MSSLLNPVGPEPASVYWRRRIVVILGVLVVLALVWWLISPGGSSAPTSASASPSPLPTLSPTTSPSVSGSPSPAVSGAPCLDDDIAVTVSMTQQSYPVGSPVEFVMKISNNGATACARDVGPAANTFTIKSGGFDVWSSDACTEAGESQVEEIPAGEAFAVKGTWDSTVTANGCASPTAAEAGAYQVEATNGDASSSPLSFTLS
ncbi:MAG: hypothetical protein MUF33_14340 [Candidatus Nanopelagicales bacterium]|jgi:hypothetical protein|nr:hypothetical protein [Candidatus Nanopelagicales bacterium]MCU0296658.1 hypothetical protein [Candidatus Nanopelagicales bacterium]MCU0299678.1 hypothetical protein [Candidatus Nanopelagicales bacterium]